MQSLRRYVDLKPFECDAYSHDHTLYAWQLTKQDRRALEQGLWLVVESCQEVVERELKLAVESWPGEVVD